MIAASDVHASRHRLRTPAAPRRPRGGRWRRGAAATEYLLILALVVLPIAMLLPLFMRLITSYAGRIFPMVGLPFP